jgi:hypothetical protein
MTTELSTDELASILDNASQKLMNDSLMEEPEINLAEDSEIVSGDYKKEKVTRIIENSTEEKIRKEQSEMLTEEIKKRFARLKKISKDNFNMLEVALLCHKLSSDYKRLAKLNRWTEIETLFEEKA